MSSYDGYNEPRPGQQLSVIRGEAEIPGMNLLSGQRCGDKDRQRAHDRVGEAYASGHLNDAEAEARRDAIGKASMLQQLENLLADLPATSRWNGTSLQKKPQNKTKAFFKWFQYRQPWTGIGTLAASILFASLPGFSVAVAGGSGIVQAMVAVPTALLGLCGCIVAVGSIGSKYDW